MPVIENSPCVAGSIELGIDGQSPVEVLNGLVGLTHCLADGQFIEAAGIFGVLLDVPAKVFEPLIELRRADQAETAFTAGDAVVGLQLEVLVDGPGRVAVEAQVLAGLRQGKENLGTLGSRFVGRQQRYDRLLRVARLRVDTCQVIEAIGIVGTLLEGHLIDLQSVRQVPGVLCREAKVIEDVEVGRLSVQCNRKGVLGLGIAPPVNIGHAN